MADQNKLKKRLEALLKLPENTYCVDCRKRGPRWASANLGIFICIECSGIHRNLGVHISFVRSVNLDSWTVPQVEFMEEWGNKRANEYYEANMPAHVVRPKEGDPVRVVERFIRDKYEHKRYMASKAPPKAVEVAAEQAHHHTPAPAAQPAPVARRQSAAVTAPAAPRPVPVAAPAAPAVASLLDFDEPVPAAPAAPVSAPFDPFAVPAAAHTQAHDFGEFMSSTPANAPPAAPIAAQNNGFADFGSPQDWAAAPPAAPAKPHASADAILSLYAQPTHTAHPQMGMGMMGGFAAPQNPFAPPAHAPQAHMPHMQQHHMMLPPQQQQQQQAMYAQQQAQQAMYLQHQQHQQQQQQQQRAPVNPFMARPAPMMMNQQQQQQHQQPQQGMPMGMPMMQGGYGMPQMQPMQGAGYPMQQPMNPFGMQQPPMQQQQQQQQAAQPFSQLSWPTH